MQAIEESISVGRKPGEVNLALLQAVHRLSLAGKGTTLRELAIEAGVGIDAARGTLRNMCQRGRLCIARYRRVSYRNRPVAEYALPITPPPEDANSQSFLARCWG